MKSIRLSEPRRMPGVVDRPSVTPETRPQDEPVRPRERTIVNPPVIGANHPSAAEQHLPSPAAHVAGRPVPKNPDVFETAWTDDEGPPLQPLPAEEPTAPPVATSSAGLSAQLLSHARDLRLSDLRDGLEQLRQLDATL